MASRTKGIPLIAALIIGASAILVFMQQGQDLMRGIAEDDFLQPGSRLLQIAFAVGLLFLAIQALELVANNRCDPTTGPIAPIGGRSNC